jgi:hypothetical protein
MSASKVPQALASQPLRFRVNRHGGGITVLRIMDQSLSHQKPQQVIEPRRSAEIQVSLMLSSMYSSEPAR